MTTRYEPVLRFDLQGMGVELPEWPEGDHPNARPWRGVLTRVDEISDRSPNGSQGHRVYIPKAVAQAALPTLIGQAVDVSSGLHDHNARRKVGIITQADIVGNDVRVSGILYAKDFPDVMQELDRHKGDGTLGMSYEITGVEVDDVHAAIWTLKRLVFTGAAILERKAAAYSKTSLQARQEAVEGSGGANGQERRPMVKMVKDVEARLAQVLSDLKAARRDEGDEDARRRDDEEEARRKREGYEDEEARRRADEEARKGNAQTMTPGPGSFRPEEDEEARRKREDEEARRHRAQSFRPEEDEEDASAIAAAVVAAMKARWRKDQAVHEDEAEDRALFKRLMDQMKAMGYRSRRRADEDAMRHRDEDEDAKAIVAAVMAAMQIHRGPQRQIPREITHLEASERDMKARRELLTDAVTRMGELLTDRLKPARKELATDTNVTGPQGGEMQGMRQNGGDPRRKTMVAAHDDRFIAKYNLEAGRQYTVQEIDKILISAKLEPEERIRVKMEMEAKGMLPPIYASASTNA